MIAHFKVTHAYAYATFSSRVQYSVDIYITCGALIPFSSTSQTGIVTGLASLGCGVSILEVEIGCAFNTISPTRAVDAIR